MSASVQGLDGQLTTYKSHLGAPHPCLRCLFDAEMADDALPSCAQGGVLGPVAGVVGTLQAVEVVKELAGDRRVAFRHAPALRRRGRALDRIGLRAPARLCLRGLRFASRREPAAELAPQPAAEGLTGYVKVKVRVARAGPPAVSGAGIGEVRCRHGRWADWTLRCATMEDAT